VSKRVELAPGRHGTYRRSWTELYEVIEALERDEQVSIELPDARLAGLAQRAAITYALKRDGLRLTTRLHGGELVVRRLE